MGSTIISRLLMSQVRLAVTSLLFCQRGHAWQHLSREEFQ